MKLKGDAKFEEKVSFGSKNDMRNLMNFNASSGKSENLHFDVVLILSIAYKFSAKNYRRNVCHDAEKRSKLWRKTDFLFENAMRNLVNFNASSEKFENLRFDGLLS